MNIKLIGYIKYNAIYIFFSFLNTVFLAGYGLRGGDYNAFLSLDYLNIDTIVARWNNWTSRTIIDWLMSFSAHNIFIFLLITLLSFWLMFSSINRILLKVSKLHDSKLLHVYVGLSFFTLFNIGLFTSAGVIATSVGFLWTLSLLVYSSTLLVDNNWSRFSVITKVCALLVATCMEQVSVISFLGLVFYIIYKLLNKDSKSAFRIAPFITIPLLQLIHAYLNPGNSARRAKEVINWFPQFDNLSIFRKIDIGFIDTMQHLFVNPFFILLALIFIVFYTSIKKRQTLVSIISGAQFFILFFYNNTQNYVVNIVNNILVSWNIKNFGSLLSTNGITMTGHGLASTLPDIYFVIMVASLGYVIWKVCRNKIERYCIFSILLLGLCSRLLMSISPTIYASGERTFVFMVFSLYIVFLILSTPYLQSNNKNKE